MNFDGRCTPSLHASLHSALGIQHAQEQQIQVATTAAAATSCPAAVARTVHTGRRYGTNSIVPTAKSLLWIDTAAEEHLVFTHSVHVSKYVSK